MTFIGRNLFLRISLDKSAFPVIRFQAIRREYLGHPYTPCRGKRPIFSHGKLAENENKNRFKIYKGFSLTQKNSILYCSIF